MSTSVVLVSIQDKEPVFLNFCMLIRRVPDRDSCWLLAVAAGSVACCFSACVECRGRGGGGCVYVCVCVCVTLHCDNFVKTCNSTVRNLYLYYYITIENVLLLYIVQCAQFDFLCKYCYFIAHFNFFHTSFYSILFKLLLQHFYFNSVRLHQSLLSFYFILYCILTSYVNVHLLIVFYYILYCTLLL